MPPNLLLVIEFKLNFVGQWNNIFINVNKKYDWDNLSIDDIEELIEEKKQKEKDKVIHNWEEEGIKVEKGRWGKFYLIKF